MFRHRSILKTFVARPRVKSSINRARITIYKYNRQKVYYMNMLKKSFTLCANKSLKKQSVNLKLNSSSKKLVTTIMNPSLNYLGYSKNKINNTNKTLPVKGIKNFVFPPLAKTKVGTKTYSTYAAPIASRYIKKTNVRYLSQKAIKPTVINSSIRKVLSVSCGTKITIPAIESNNLSIIRSEKKDLSGGPNLVISRSDSQEWLENSYNRHGMNKSDPNLKKLRKSVESIKNKLKKSKSNILYLFSSNNNQIILTEVRKGHKKYTDSQNIAELTKLPFNKKVPGIFKRANKAVKVFTPKLYSINKIRY
jgi:hypothetical protein